MKSDQSDDERSPRAVDDAVERLNVMFEPLEVTEKSLAPVEVLIVRAPVKVDPNSAVNEDTPFCIEVVATQVGMPFERERM